MKTSYLLIILLSLNICSCKEEKGEISVKNEISNAKILDVRFGDKYITNQLLPGETSYELEIKDDKDNWPKVQRISFTMSSNNKTVFLQTDASYTLNFDDNLLIKLSDSTKVSNP